MLASPLALFRRLPPAVRLLITGALVNRLGGFIVPYLAIVLRREFRLSPSEVGLLLTCYGTGSLVSVLIGGGGADPRGPPPAMRGSPFGGGRPPLFVGAGPSPSRVVPPLRAFRLGARPRRPPRDGSQPVARPRVPPARGRLLRLRPRLPHERDGVAPDHHRHRRLSGAGVRLPGRPQRPADRALRDPGHRRSAALPEAAR